MSFRKCLTFSRHAALKFQSFQFRILLQNGIRVFKVCKSTDSKLRAFAVSFISPLLFIKALCKPETKTSEKIVKAADDLYNDAKYDELYDALTGHRDSSDPEVLWRCARATFEKCRPFSDDKLKLQYYEEALQLVERALEIDEKCWAAHKWKAILLDYVWRYKSTKGRIIHSFDIKKHMERAIDLNPSDSTSYYILGEWCYTFADMPWYQRNVAAALFASPPSSTYEEALQFFEKAEKISPSFYSMNLLMMGKCYLKLRDKETAISYFKQARDYPIKTPDDQKAHEEATKILKDFKI